LYRMERRKPVGSISVLKEFFEEELNRIYLFFRENEDFYQYYRAEAEFMDETFFLPGGNTPQIALDEYSCILDTHLCTAHGYKIARIMACEKLQNNLNQR